MKKLANGVAGLLVVFFGVCGSSYGDTIPVSNRNSWHKVAKIDSRSLSSISKGQMEIARSPSSNSQFLIDGLPPYAKSILKLLPKKMENSIVQILEILTQDGETPISSESLFQANRGIESFNRGELASDQCFRELSEHFYIFIGQLNAKNFPSIYNGGMAPRQVTRKKFSLGEDLENTMPHLKLGWLWEVAMQFSDGDPNLAMSLIGIKGHDDVVEPFDERNNAVIGVPTQFQDICRRVKAVPGFLPKVLSQSVNTSLICEGEINIKDTKLMYLSGSLEVDISPELKEKITRVQSPNLGANALPSKYYHVLGSAFTSCKLKNAGLPGALVTRLQLQAIDTYRATRLCAQKFFLMRSTFLLDPSISTQDVWEIVEPFLFKGEVGSVNFDNPEILSALKKNLRGEGANGFYSVLKRIDYLKNSNLPKAAIFDAFARRVALGDAGTIFISSEQYEKMNRCEGYQMFSGLDRWLQKHGTGGSKNPCPKEFNEDRCREVRDLFSTWAIDFEWSKAQHKVGSQFGVQHCTKTEEPLAGACAALEKIKTPN